MSRYRVGLALFLVVLLRLHNAWVFPPYWGLDANGHCQNILIISQQLRLPDAQDGWSGYHPPLYYLLSSLPWLVFRADPLLFAKLLSALSSLALMGLAYLTVRPHYPQLAWLGALMIGVWPSDIVHACMCMNIELGAAVCAFWVFLEYRTRSARWELRWSALGLVSGAAMLTRPEGLVTVGWLAWVACLDIRSRPPCERGQSWRVMLGATWALTLGALSIGWFFCRNQALYGRWMLSNLDGDMFPWSVADPGLGFSWPGFVCIWAWVIPDFSLWSTPQFPGGSGSSLTVLFASGWLDYTGVIHRPVNLLVERLFMLFGLAASLAMVWGGLRRPFLKGEIHEDTWRGMVVMTLVVFLLFNLRVPCVTSAKVPYLNPMYLPCLYYLLGAHSLVMRRWPRWGRWLPDLWVAMAFLVTWRFWSPSGI